MSEECLEDVLRVSEVLLEDVGEILEGVCEFSRKYMESVWDFLKGVLNYSGNIFKIYNYSTKFFRQHFFIQYFLSKKYFCDLAFLPLNFYLF